MSRNGTCVAIALLPLTLSASTPSARASELQGTVVINHHAVGCVVAAKFSTLEARLEPADSISRARIYFQAAGHSSWYYVEMTRDGDLFRGTLPSPLKETKQIRYYINAMDSGMNEARTAEFEPMVGSAGECDKRGLLVAAPLTNAMVSVGAVGGGAPLPAGFASAGVSSASSGAGAAGVAGGGHGTTALVVGGLAAAGGAVAVVAATHNSAAAEPASVAGTWTGSQTWTLTSASLSCPQTVDSLSWTLTQSGTAISGSETFATTQESATCTDGSTTAGVLGSLRGPYPVTGTLTGKAVTLTVSFPTSGSCTYTGTLSGNVMNGQENCDGYVDPTRRISGTWNVSVSH